MDEEGKRGKGWAQNIGRLEVTMTATVSRAHQYISKHLADSVSKILSPTVTFTLRALRSVLHERTS
jgi:hypothetical protein